MSKVGVTEIDILKNIVRENFDKSLESKNREEFIKNQREQCKLYLKIWSATTKFIKSQCDKGRLIDTMYFGLFFRSESPDLLYVHVPHSDILVINKLKLKQNEENLSKVPTSMESRYVLLNLQSIANVCECKVEVVNYFLSKLRDSMLETISNNKASMVQANLRIGILTINKLKEIEFSTLKDQVPLSSNLNPSNISKVEMSEPRKIESNLYNMQMNQMNKTSGSPTVFRAFKYNLDQGSDQRKKPSARNSFYGQSQQQMNQRTRSQQNTQMANYKNQVDKLSQKGDQNSQLNQFLKNHSQNINLTKDSVISQSPLKNNNYIIEQLYKMKKNNATAEQIREKALNFSRYQSIPTSQNAPDLPQISSNKKTPKSNPRHNQLQSIQIQKPQSQSSNVSRTLQRRTSDHGRDIQNDVLQSYKNNVTLANESLNSFEQSQYIGRALDRKQISSSYHVEYPQFLKSNGPFKVYNHHKEVGFDIYDSIKKAKKNASQKIQEELNQLKARREFEKQIFQQNLQTESEIIRSQQELQKQNNIDNSNYLKLQMEEKQRQKMQERIENNQNYKTSFGPEETEELIEEMRQKRIFDQMVEKRNLINQMLNKQQQMKLDQEKAKEEEHQALQNFNQTIAEEEKAKMQKVHEQKLKLKKAWEDQMEKKRLKNQYDKIFQ